LEKSLNIVFFFKIIIISERLILNKLIRKVKFSTARSRASKSNERSQEVSISSSTRAYSIRDIKFHYKFCDLLVQIQIVIISINIILSCSNRESNYQKLRTLEKSGILIPFKILKI
jgi:hypothetical protein